VPASKIDEITQSVIKTNGPLKSINETPDPHKFVLVFERGSSDATIILEGNEIQTLFIKPAGATAAPLDAPIDVAVVSSPAAFRADGHTHYVFELNITNFSHQDVSLRKIDIESRGASLAHLEGAELGAATSHVEIGPGLHSIAYLWVTADVAPATLDNHITVHVANQDMSVNVRVPVREGTPLAISSPLRGKWWMAANGPSNTSNHRRAIIPVGGHAHISQRFAIDWVKVDDDGKTFHGESEKNESYYAYGAEALAVADGVVTETKDGIPQNVPGSNRAVAITLETIGGNHVVVDLGGGRFAFWAHLQPGSLRVKVGDHVKRGQVIGLVGNTGNSTEPHLHFHISDASSPLASEGVPYAFDSFQLRAADKSVTAKTKQLPTEKEIVAFP
jgi:murein DD-endopeptidase